MKEIPYGISNYEELIEENYYYVDKTNYIEKLEGLPQKRVMFLRPRKFGKTLFTSMLENYYDIKKEDKFEILFKETYIGKNPTKTKNSYYILRFNFSAIDTDNKENTIKGFRKEVASSIKFFVDNYGLDFYINDDDEAENILSNLFKAFYIQKRNEKIYVIIDEYDHFANELLGFQTEEFKNIISKNGKVRKWYEALKRGTESVVDRIFVTGVAPITLDSMTSGFNIIKDLTQDPRFNEMMGFSEEELIKIMESQEIDRKKQKELLPIMKENYDGYKFSKDAKIRLYNSNMCLYFLDGYTSFGKIPEELVDTNIASDYSKIGNMLRLCKNENRLDIIEKTVSGEAILTSLIRQFSPEKDEFEETEMVSMLYYLGYLTITGERLGKVELSIPNQAIREIYAEYFIKILEEDANLKIGERDDDEILEEIAIEGKIDKITNVLQKYLNNLSNRDYIKFDEKYVKLIFYCIVMNFRMFWVKSEMEIERNYPDILLIPKDLTKNYYSIMVEFKYLKKGEENRLKEKQKEARDQIERYSNLEEVKSLKNIRKYTVVTVVDKLYIEEI